MEPIKDDFLGVHYRVSVAFRQRPVNGRSPNSALVAGLARESEEAPLETEEQWRAQYVQDWCQGNEEHPLMGRKPAVVPWRAWYLKSMKLELSEGDTLNKRWRQWLREMGWEQMSHLQRLAFDGSLHLIEPMVKKALAEPGGTNPLLKEPNVLVYVVLSRSVDTMSFLLRNGFGTPEELRRGETWTGFTALHVALFTQQREMVALLWNSYKVNVNARDLYFGSALDYCRLLGIVTNCEMYIKGGSHIGHAYGYQTMEHFIQLTMRQNREWNDPDKHLFETRNVKEAEKVHVLYYNKKANEMERMPLAEWSDLVRCIYQPFISAKDSWIDELMFNGVYVEDPTRESRRLYAAHLRNLPKFETPANLVMSYVNARIGFACYAARNLKRGDVVTNFAGMMHSDRYKWKDVEKTTPFRLNFMKQIHDLGEKGEGIIKKPVLPRYSRNPNFNLAVPGTSYFVNAFECGNMARVINHSATHANVALEMVWNAGVPQVLVLALREIDKGEQILLNYEQMWQYFEQRKENRRLGEKKSIQNFDEDEMFMLRGEKDFFNASQTVEMGEGEGFPHRIDTSKW